MEQNDDVRRKAGDMENIRTSPGDRNETLVFLSLCVSLCMLMMSCLSACTGSPHYSEDFEEEEDVKEPLDEVRNWNQP